MTKYFALAMFLLPFSLSAQTKKPLTHNVYDGWKSAGERSISNDGNYVAYAINPQEGDGNLYVRNMNTGYEKIFPRGFNANFTSDSRFVVLSIKAPFQEMRQARIKKKKPDEMPKDSLFVLLLGTDSIIKVPRVQSYKIPEKSTGLLTYLLDKPLPDSTRKKQVTDSLKQKIDMLTKAADSVIRKSLDSVKGRITKQEVIGAANKAVKEIYKRADELESMLADADNDDADKSAPGADGYELKVRNLLTNDLISFAMVKEYQVDKQGNMLVIETAKKPKDSTAKSAILIYHFATEQTDTIMRGLNDARNFAFDETGMQLSFVAERDSSSKALQKFYKLWYYKAGLDSAQLLVHANSIGMPIGSTVSENATPRFSKNGLKLFFGTAPIPPVKDTTLVDFELARLDLWHYNDDYLQPQQLRQLGQEQRRSFLAVIKPGSEEMVQLGRDTIENMEIVDEGNADWVLGETSRGHRIAMQWEGRSQLDAYIINTSNGHAAHIPASGLVNASASPRGNFVYWYDIAGKQYYTYNVRTAAIKNVSSKIPVPLYDTENDVPDYPRAAGFTGWMSADEYMLVNDEFDIWQLDPNAEQAPKNITQGFGRTHQTSFNYVRLDPEQRFFNEGDSMLLVSLNKLTKEGGMYLVKAGIMANPQSIETGKFSPGAIRKAKDAEVYLLQKSTPASSELYYGKSLANTKPVTDIAAQQRDYNWLTTELVKWKMFDGKMSEGILYKPQDFDPKKKYPIIFYFYERNADGLYSYKAPAPSASTINIPYFVSNGYLVFDPNIYYKTGEPGQSAYNSVVSAAQFLGKMPWVNASRMAIQGQSWGGYQVAYLITRTNMFRAAGAGAPVANMTSAYGGIRWGAGINRQFQYEKSQSRIGATLWQRPDLYIKNSPLFAADKVQTPVLLMHNDADGAVPWYQSIEFFTALKRLGKKAWLLQYNGEDHNLVERRNRKDLSIRLSQFFDYYLKDARPASWIINGLPATSKGISWGTDIID